MFTQPFQQVYAVTIGQAQVRQYQVYIFGLNVFLGPGNAADRIDPETFFAEPCFQHHTVSDVIFYD